MSNYVDQYGRWHHKPVTEADPLPSNNAYIYSFYAKMLNIPVQFNLDIQKQILNIDTIPLTRHPGDNTPSISHDEYVGVAGMNKGWAKRICNFGEHNYWQFCDIPGFIPIPFRKLVLDDVMASYEDLANEEHPRLAVIKYPSIWPIAFWHRPEHQYFYLRCAGRSPGIARTLYFIGASIATIASQGEGNIMLKFKMLRLEKEATLIEKVIHKLVDRFGKFKEHCREVFPKDHPILERVEKL